MLDCKIAEFCIACECVSVVIFKKKIKSKAKEITCSAREATTARALRTLKSKLHVGLFFILSGIGHFRVP